MHDPMLPGYQDVITGDEPMLPRELYWFECMPELLARAGIHSNQYDRWETGKFNDNDINDTYKFSRLVDLTIEHDCDRLWREQVKELNKAKSLSCEIP